MQAFRCPDVKTPPDAPRAAAVKRSPSCGSVRASSSVDTKPARSPATGWEPAGGGTRERPWRQSRSCSAAALGAALGAAARDELSHLPCFRPACVPRARRTRLGPSPVGVSAVRRARRPERGRAATAPSRHQNDLNIGPASAQNPSGGSRVRPQTSDPGEVSEACGASRRFRNVSGAPAAASPRARNGEGVPGSGQLWPVRLIRSGAPPGVAPGPSAGRRGPGQGPSVGQG